MDNENAARVLLRFLRYAAAKNEFSALKRRQAKRLHIVKEVLSTEEVYVTNLEVLVGVRIKISHSRPT